MWVLGLSAAPDPGLAELRLTVTEVRHHQGFIYGGLFREGDAFPKSEGRWRFTRAEAGPGNQVLLVFSNIPPGTYAIGFFQDLDGNRIHDRGFLTVPKEPFGFYRHQKPRFREPDFRDCCFELKAGITNAVSPMQEWGK